MLRNKLTYLLLVMAILSIGLTSCQKDEVPEPVPSTEQIQENVVSDSSEDEHYSAFKTATGDPSESFLEIVNQITGDAVNDLDYDWECCLVSTHHPEGLGNWSNGNKFFVQAPDGNLKPAFFFAAEAEAGDSLEAHGLRVYFRSGGAKDMPVDNDMGAISIYFNNVYVGDLNLNLGSWNGIEELRLYSMPNMEPLGLNHEFCYALVHFDHKEDGDNLLCPLNENLSQFLYGNIVRTFTLTTLVGETEFNWEVFAGMSSNGEYGLYDAVTQMLVLPIVSPGPNTELVRVKLFEGGQFLVTVLWTVPTWAVHGEGSGCPLKLRTKSTSECDGEEVDCSAADLNIMQMPDIPVAGSNVGFPLPLDQAIRAIYGTPSSEQTYRTGLLPNWDNGTVVFGKFSDEGKYNQSLALGKYIRANSGGAYTFTRIAVGRDINGSPVVHRQNKGSMTLDTYYWDDDGTPVNVTINGQTFVWMLDDWLQNAADFEIELMPLEVKRPELLSNGSPIDLANFAVDSYPVLEMGSLGLIKDVGGEVIIDNDDNKGINLVEEECYYRIKSGNQIYYTASGLPGKKITFGLDKEISNYYVFVFDENNNFEGRMLIRNGMPLSSTQAGATSLWYPIQINFETHWKFIYQ